MIANDPRQWADSPERARPPAWAGFDVNHTVRVRLTQTGLAEYRRVREEFNAANPKAGPLALEPKLDDEGYYSDQMWSLMRDFGHLCRLFGEPPFETTILLPADHLAPAP